MNFSGAYTCIKFTAVRKSESLVNKVILSKLFISRAHIALNAGSTPFYYPLTINIPFTNLISNSSKILENFKHLFISTSKTIVFTY